MPTWLLALLGGALSLLAVKLGSWWRGREVARVREQLARTEAERDAAGGRAITAEAQANALEQHVERQQAADQVAEEIRDAAPAGLDPDERRARLHAWVRAHARGEGLDAGGGEAAAVRAPPAASPERDDDRR